MELPGIGNRCTVKECQQLDFLPLHCQCGQVFCSQHFSEHSQTCTKSKFLSEDELKFSDNPFVCSQEGCTDRSIVPIARSSCGKHFCVKHRHLATCEDKTQDQLQQEKDKFLQPVRQFVEARTLVDKQIESSLVEGRKKSKTKELACKIQLMRIKNKATGLQTISMSDRVYFNIHLSGKIVPLFVCRSWSLGRVIDSIADECKLRNNNNKPKEKRLRLFKKDDLQMISDDMSRSLLSLLSDKILVDGEDIVIQYVDV